jgi:hypothetical protein
MRMGKKVDMCASSAVGGRDDDPYRCPRSQFDYGAPSEEASTSAVMENGRTCRSPTTQEGKQ